VRRSLSRSLACDSWLYGVAHFTQLGSLTSSCRTHFQHDCAAFLIVIVFVLVGDSDCRVFVLKAVLIRIRLMMNKSAVFCPDDE
jgi:hypothetical protein